MTLHFMQWQDMTLASSPQLHVLFVCTGNSARSLLAEALLRSMAGNRFKVSSAGTEPGVIDPRTLTALADAGVPSEGLHSKSLEAFTDEHIDFVITLCDKAHRECQRWPGTGVVMAWDFTDPRQSADPHAFDKTLLSLKERLQLFIQVNEKQVATGIQTVTPLAFYKALADETRLICLLLVEQQERCVCELVQALAQSQPKVSRHLAQLRKAGLLLDRRQGQWVYYRLHPLLNDWMRAVLHETRLHSNELLAQPLARLQPVDRKETCSA